MPVVYVITLLVVAMQVVIEWFVFMNLHSFWFYWPFAATLFDA